MARMKFLCDADRCIECNACVTACKNENEVPWGTTRSTSSPSMTAGRRALRSRWPHACHDAPARRYLQGMPSCPTRRHHAALQGRLHRLRLLLLRLPVRRPAISAIGNFGSRGKINDPPSAPAARKRTMPPPIPGCGAPSAPRQAPLCADICSTSPSWPATAASSRKSRRVLERGYGCRCLGWKTAYRETIVPIT